MCFSCLWLLSVTPEAGGGSDLLGFQSGSQLELLAVLPDLDVVDFVLVEDHEGEGLVGLLPGTVPHQVGPVLHTHTDTHYHRLSAQPVIRVLMLDGFSPSGLSSGIPQPVHGSPSQRTSLGPEPANQYTHTAEDAECPQACKCNATAPPAAQPGQISLVGCVKF